MPETDTRVVVTEEDAALLDELLRAGAIWPGSREYDAMKGVLARHRLAALSQAEARVGVLREALRPFAGLPFDSQMPDDLTDEEALDWYDSYALSAGAIRAARLALNPDGAVS